MAAELCNRGCGLCGRCDPPWEDRDDAEAEFLATVEETEELIKKVAENDRLYRESIRRFFKEGAA